MAFVIFKRLRVLLSALAALVLLTGSSAAPVIGEIDKAITFLSQYGYLNPSLRDTSIAHMIDETSMSRAVAEFQSFVGLKVTGELDEETKKQMSLPRCGVRDKVFGANRSKRYVLQGYKWNRKSLTYKISKYPSDSKLSNADVDADIARAFSVWTDHTDLTFKRKTSGAADIEIRFVRGNHGDADPFDGPGGTLAHAFFPDGGGDAHFDDAENWTKKSRRGINLFQVAAHEFGHTLGLDHSSERSAVMFPTYQKFDPSYRLDQDDIRGIQSLYGQKTLKRSANGGGWRLRKNWIISSINDFFHKYNAFNN